MFGVDSFNVGFAVLCIVISLNMCKVMNLERALCAFFGAWFRAGMAFYVRSEGRDCASAALRPSQCDGGLCAVPVLVDTALGSVLC